MQQSYKVAIHHGNDYGFVEYDQESKKVKVVLDNAAIRQVVETYLASEHVIRLAGEGLMDFKDVTVRPAESIDNLQAALTRMWEKIGVYVDWSHPVA
ncbi:hypothetical protein SCACP_39770 [Sporomusa carbonis]